MNENGLIAFIVVAGLIADAMIELLLPENIKMTIETIVGGKDEAFNSWLVQSLLVGLEIAVIFLIALTVYNRFFGYKEEHDIQEVNEIVGQVRDEKTEEYKYEEAA